MGRDIGGLGNIRHLTRAIKEMHKTGELEALDRRRQGLERMTQREELGFGHVRVAYESAVGNQGYTSGTMGETRQSYVVGVNEKSPYFS